MPESGTTSSDRPSPSRSTTSGQDGRAIRVNREFVFDVNRTRPRGFCPCSLRTRPAFAGRRLTWPHRQDVGLRRRHQVPHTGPAGPARIPVRSAPARFAGRRVEPDPLLAVDVGHRRRLPAGHDHRPAGSRPGTKAREGRVDRSVPQRAAGSARDRLDHPPRQTRPNALTDRESTGLRCPGGVGDRCSISD